MSSKITGHSREIQVISDPRITSFQTEIIIPMSLAVKAMSHAEMITIVNALNKMPVLGTGLNKANEREYINAVIIPYINSGRKQSLQITNEGDKTTKITAMSTRVRNYFKSKILGNISGKKKELIQINEINSLATEFFDKTSYIIKQFRDMIDMRLLGSEDPKII